MLGTSRASTVYRATDERFGRDVAVKVLSDPANASPERHAELLREARMAGALTHTNIATVLDIGVDGATPYVVSELIEGQSLRSEVARGALPIGRLLSIGLQVAEGMAAAHAAGVVHGDLKPDNVMIARNGHVKIIDFGLATAIEQLTSSTESLATPTETIGGLIVGTPAYASPERARGAAVDARSDQFSFGVILFEMATGRRPFDEKSPVETLSAVLKNEAPGVRSLNPKVPLPLQWIVERCLAKEPANRYGSPEDLVLDLRAVHERSIQPGPDASDQRARRGPLAMLAAGLLIGSLAVAVWIWGAWRPDRIAIGGHKYTPFAGDPGFQGQPAWSPNGTTIAYAGEVDGVLQIFIRSVGATKGTQITFSPFDCDHPFWSSDDAIFYLQPLGTKVALYRIAAIGGAPELVEENATAAAVSPDGRTLAFFKEESDDGGAWTLWFESPIGSAPRRYQSTPLGNVGFSGGALRFSPDGTRLLVWVSVWSADRNVFTHSGFYEISMKDHKSQQVLRALPEPLLLQTFDWFPDSRHIAAGDRGSPVTHLWIADIDTDSFWQITSGSESTSSPSVSRGGRIAYSQQGTNFDLVIVPIDGSPLKPLLNGSSDEFDPAWSARNHDEFAYATDKGGMLEIRRHVGEDDEFPLVSPADFETPTWGLGSLAYSPDGNDIAYQRLSQEGYRIWLSPLARSGPHRLTQDDAYEDAPTFSPSGDVAFVQASRALWNLVRITRGARAQVIVAGSVVSFGRPQWSPDGHLIAFKSAYGLSVVDPDTTRVTDLSREDWLAFAWAADGRLYGLTRDDDRVHFSLSRIDATSKTTETISPHLGLIPLANEPIRGFTWMGHGFATSIANVKSDIWILDNVNWRRSFLELFAPGTRR